MPGRRVSTGSLIARLMALLRRHRLLDGWIDSEQAHRLPDSQNFKSRKGDRPKLRDAIRQIKSTLMHSGLKAPTLS